MTDDRIEGVARKGVGHLQDAVGGLVGDNEVQAKGKLNEVAGSVQDAYGRVQDKAKEAVSRAGSSATDILGSVEGFIRDEPLVAGGLLLGTGILIGFLLGRKAYD